MMRRPWFWPAVVVALLLFGVGANVILLVVATSDPSFAVEPDYYRKALRWDEKMAQDARNDALGWTVALHATPLVERGVPAAEIAVRLLDASGRPLSGARVAVEAFHLARSATVHDAILDPGAGGQYRATMPLRRPGLWEFRFEITRGTDRFTYTEQKEIGSRWPRS